MQMTFLETVHALSAEQLTHLARGISLITSWYRAAKTYTGSESQAKLPKHLLADASEDDYVYMITTMAWFTKFFGPKPLQGPFYRVQAVSDQVLKTLSAKDIPLTVSNRRTITSWSVLKNPDIDGRPYSKWDALFTLKKLPSSSSIIWSYANKPVVEEAIMELSGYLKYKAPKQKLAVDRLDALITLENTLKSLERRMDEFHDEREVVIYCPGLKLNVLARRFSRSN